MQTKVWMLLVVLALSAACSRTKSAQDVSQETPQIELSDAEEIPADQPVADAGVEAPVDASSEEAPIPDALAADADAEAPVINDDVVLADDSAPAVSVPLANGPVGEYVVEKNETLMMIAFKIYGDYGKWRDLAARNSGALKGGNKVWSGLKLKYATPSSAFSWSPQGNPYLIRHGDTLGSISGTVYGTRSKWKTLWENNRPMIKDPNRIFAGFTLYWQEIKKVAANAGLTF